MLKRDTQTEVYVTKEAQTKVYVTKEAQTEVYATKNCHPEYSAVLFLLILKAECIEGSLDRLRDVFNNHGAVTQDSLKRRARNIEPTRLPQWVCNPYLGFHHRRCFDAPSRLMKFVIIHGNFFRGGKLPPATSNGVRISLESTLRR